MGDIRDAGVAHRGLRGERLVDQDSCIIMAYLLLALAVVVAMAYFYVILASSWDVDTTDREDRLEESTVEDGDSDDSGGGEISICSTEAALTAKKQTASGRVSEGLNMKNPGP